MPLYQSIGCGQDTISTTRQSKTYQVKYKNIFDAFYKISKHEGVRGLQKGLAPALSYQIVMNSLRLGLYQSINNAGITTGENGKPVFLKLAIAGAFSGSVGAFAASPLFLIKIQMQSKAADSIAVGYQHSHKGMWSAFRTIATSPSSMFQGVTSAIARVSVGSATQLATFTKVKHFFKSGGHVENEIGVVVLSSLVSSVAVCATMTPFDVVSTRMYNQTPGLYYSGWSDCVGKIFEVEGVKGFYKGTVAHYFRIGPHTILTLIIWDYYRKSFL